MAAEPATHDGGGMALLHSPPGTIVVGVDGSAGSDRSLEWAVRQAVLAHRGLTVVHGMNLLGPGQTTLSGASLIGPPELFDVATRDGHAVVDAAVRRARVLAPDLEMYEILSQADPRQALLDESARASMVVIGSRGRGPVSTLLLGSVGVAVSKHADCPVVVVRPEQSDVVRGGILVGVDGTDLDRDVVEFAFRLASHRAQPLTVFHCFWDATHLGRRDRQVPDDETGLDDKRALLRDAVDAMTEKFPDVHPHPVLARGFADQQLIERSRTMDVVVVGSRRPGPLSFGFSSLAPTVIEHAGCAVAVVPLRARAHDVELTSAG